MILDAYAEAHNDETETEISESSTEGSRVDFKYTSTKGLQGTVQLHTSVPRWHGIYGAVFDGPLPAGSRVDNCKNIPGEYMTVGSSSPYWNRADLTPSNPGDCGIHGLNSPESDRE